MSLVAPVLLGDKKVVCLMTDSSATQLFINLKGDTMFRIFTVFALFLFAGCSSMTPTQNTEASFVIYDVQPASINRGQLLDAITHAVQKNQQKVRVTRDIQMGELPEKPGRFTLKDPFANTNIGAMMSANGQSTKMPVCDNSILTLASGSNNTSGNTTFFLCVIPYKAGYSVNIYSTFSSSSGGINAIGASLAKSVLGDSSQYIPRAMNEVRTATESVGGKVAIIDSYIPDSFKGAFVDQTGSLKQ